jgi:hypothetical protein
MPKTRLSLLILLFLTKLSPAQGHFGIGYTGASINSYGGISGGLSLVFGCNFAEWDNSSFSISTNWKIGYQDKIGSALIIPLAIVSDQPPPNSGGGAGGTLHLFMELPLLVHYNFGLGSTSRLSLRENFGFYLGGGISAVSTGYADTAGYSKAASFTGYVLDGGIRFNGKTDLNFATVVSFNGPIGQIRRPLLFELTWSAFFR